MSVPGIKRIVVAGAAGRLGAALCDELVSAGHDVVPLGRADMDICQADQVRAVMNRVEPHVIVNCSAYNAVDAAQADEASAFAVNARGPAILADAATAAGTVLVHFSTDFVFDGEARQPYSEDDPVNPLSVYGASKLAGEVGVRRAPRHYVLRVESLFGGLGVRGHRSTVDHIAETLRAGGMVRALADRTVSPSYVPDVAQATRALLEGNAPSGTYHCVSSGFTTWFDLAREIAQRLAVSESRIEPAMIADFETAAPRPQFCALSNEKLRAAGICMPVWQSAIERHLATNGSQLC